MKEQNLHISALRQKGFTLIEIMISAVILFASIAVVSMIYRGAFISSQKASNHVAINGVIPSTLQLIERDIKNNANQDLIYLSGGGFAFDIDYSWQAELLKFEAAPQRLDVDSGDYVQPDKKYKLWQVELELERNGLKKKYSYKELSWNEK